MSPLIAIDGPAGSGKSTVARLTAEQLGLGRLDTGAMYRAVTLLVLRAGVDLADAWAAGEIARAMRLETGERVLLDGEDVTEAIRSEEVDRSVSAV
ncbi:MAG: (d)CMP kinase, partial [Acidimicrobiales bacterium]